MEDLTIPRWISDKFNCFFKVLQSFIWNQIILDEWPIRSMLWPVCDNVTTLYRCLTSLNLYLWIYSCSFQVSHSVCLWVSEKFWLNVESQVLMFKNNLDHFLTEIPDQPTMHSMDYAAENDSLLHQIPMVHFCFILSGWHVVTWNTQLLFVTNVKINEWMKMNN